MRDETVGSHHFLFSNIRRIKAKILGHGILALLDDSCFQQRVQGNAVMPVGSGDDERQGDAILVDKQMSLGAVFFPDPLDSAR